MVREGDPLAERLLEAGEQVVDFAVSWLRGYGSLDTGHNRKTDTRDAHSIEIVAVRTAILRV